MSTHTDESTSALVDRMMASKVVQRLGLTRGEALAIAAVVHAASQPGIVRCPLCSVTTPDGRHCSQCRAVGATDDDYCDA